jgi:hypothetical protein
VFRRQIGSCSTIYQRLSFVMPTSIFGRKYDQTHGKYNEVVEVDKAENPRCSFMSWKWSIPVELSAGKSDENGQS